ncbi:hypothetical protein AAFP35_19525 [Gordonia sp. CPCC 206044]|uniref:SWIM zinc finger family protein n=1 Tax=Gordonia sp. CPCC 206044 TaxID=3140793 RepID=UPI003AF39E91
MSPGRTGAGRASRTRGPGSTRGYGVTRWGRAFVDVVEGAGSGEPDRRRITQARRYFRDRHAHRLHIGAASVSASVRGSQLDPFDVTLTMRAVDAGTVVDLLRHRDAAGDLMTLTRGEQPTALGELLLPTESADIAADCTCPDEAPRCIHVLCVAYEVAAEIDRNPTTLLTVMGTDLSELLDAASRRSGDDRFGTEDDTAAAPVIDFYGTHATLPPLPAPPPMNPLMDLDGDALRSALRASGISPADVGETLDTLDLLYTRLRDN